MKQGQGAPERMEAMGEETELYDGCCGFCGQVVQYDKETLSRAGMNPELAAKLACDCMEAAIFQTRRENIRKGIQKVESIAGRDSGKPMKEEVVSYLRHAVKDIVDNNMQKITVQASGIEKVTVAATKKGIKVSREVKQTRDSEIEMLL